jgi:RNA polymerase sigma factor FliA
MTLQLTATVQAKERPETFPKTPLSAEMREQLILEHLPQVRLVARRIRQRVPDNVCLDDLISTGVMGLISAIDHFDASHNVKLKTYAEHRIRGAILDGLRGLDWAPRQRRQRSRQIEAAIVSCERRLQRSADELEIAQELGIGIAEYHEWLLAIQGLNVGSIETASDDDDPRNLLNFVAANKAEWPSRLFERSELTKILASAIAKMPEAEKTVLNLYYHEEMTLREIAKILHLHESRISQIKSQAIIRVRAYLEKRWPKSGFQRDLTGPATQNIPQPSNGVGTLHP